MAARESIATWRAAHQAARESLLDRFRHDHRVAPLLKGLSRVTDQLLSQVWQAQDLPARSALVAVGGYGREDMYPQSDVDVLILHGDDLDEAGRARFEPLVGLLWDVGIPIGHSVRSVSDCVEEAARDITIQTNLLEARLITGDPVLFQDFHQRYLAHLDPLAFLEAKRLEQRNRHGRFADRALLLEPNLKESPGGFRDVQTVAWVCLANGLPSDFAGLARAGVLSPSEARRLTRRVTFLSQLRVRLHLLARRREDRLLFEFQETLAQEMGCPPQGARRASERLMQRYFQTVRELALFNEIMLGTLAARLRPPEPILPLAAAPGFQRIGSLLDVYDETLYERQPDTLLETFRVLQDHTDLRGFTPRTLRALWRASARVDARFRADKRHQAQFIALFQQPRGITLCLRLMHRLGILGRYLPAFARVTGQMQHDLFHIHPVDDHILMVLRNLRRLALSEYAHEHPFAHRLMLEYPRRDLLYLAALFHDIAKGRGGDHSRLGEVDARRFCRRHGLPAADTEMVAWLVREHLSLSSTAQKQDISDPDVIAAFAQRCGNANRLTALYLLTVADIRGTNPQIWNSWKDKLTRDLYLAARRHLEGDQAAPDNVEAKKEQARATLRLYGFWPGAEQKLWSRLDDIYFLRQEAQAIAWQTRRLLPLLDREPLVVRARLAPIGEGVEVLVYAPDEAHVFARICGFFTSLNYTVLQAKVHTTRDGYALDSFMVMEQGRHGAPYRDILNYIEFELAVQLKHRAPLADIAPGRLPRQLRSFPLEPEITLAAVEGGPDHMLSLAAGDRPGLLYDVARLLDRHGIGVRSARINTLGQRAEDVFVLTGAPLENPNERLLLEQELIAALKVGR